MTVFPPDIPIDRLIDDFKERYIKEVDSNYCGDRIELSSSLNPILVEILTGIATGVGQGFLHRLGGDIYGFLKEKLKQRFYKEESAYPSLEEWGEGKLHVYRGDNPQMLVIEGHPRDNAILEIGDVRPLFDVQRDYFLVLRNVTIKYIGDKSTLIKESSGPAFVPINVKFVQATHRENTPGEFQIRSPIWVGEPSKNPYSGQRRQDDFIDMYA